MSESPHEYVRETIETVLHEFIHEEGRPHVHDPVEINGGHCRRFADRVIERLDPLPGVTRHDAWDIHTWIEVDGKHYDAEHVEGVDDPHVFPLWKRLTDARREIAVESCDALDPSRFPE